MVLILFFWAVQVTFRLEEITNNCYQQLEDEKKRRIVAVQTLTISENNVADLKKKLAEEQQARSSADSALDGAQRQAEDQRKRLHVDYCQGADGSTQKTTGGSPKIERSGGRVQG